MQHGSAPDQGLVARIEKSNRDDPYAIALDGNDAITLGDLRRFVGAEHERNVRAVDIGIEQSDLVTQAGQSDGKVHRQSGFSYAALAGADSDNRLHARNGLRFLRLRSRPVSVRQDGIPFAEIKLDYIRRSQAR